MKTKSLLYASVIVGHAFLASFFLRAQPGGTTSGGLIAQRQSTTGSPGAVAPSQASSAGGGLRYVATAGIGFAPWTFDLKFEGAAVTGTASQANSDPQSGSTTLIGPFSVYDGHVDGDKLTFKLSTPNGGRIITFNGTRSNDQIAFTRTVEVLSGDAGMNGILGGSGAREFIATLGGAAPAEGLPGSGIPPVRMVNGPAGRWQVAGAPSGPWLFDFTVNPTNLQGTVRQSGTPSSPTTIAGGKTDGTTVSFTVLSPDAGRLIVFRGRINGNEASFVREINVLGGGTRGGNDLYGGSAPLQFIATRVVSGVTPTPVVQSPTVVPQGPIPGALRFVAAANVGFSPWMFDLKIQGETVLGSATQASSDPTSGTTTTLVGPFEVLEGRAAGNQITFKLRSPSGAGAINNVVTFTGTRNGDQINFKRSVEVQGTDPGRNGILGGGGATEFIAILNGPMLVAPTASSAPVNPGLAVPPLTFIPPGEGITGTWLIEGVGNGPWSLQMRQEGRVVTGAIRQSVSGNGPLAQPATLQSGAVDGTNIKFSFNTPGTGTVTFTGVIQGESIEFSRTGGLAGGVGLFGAGAARQFTAKRQATESPEAVAALSAPPASRALPQPNPPESLPSLTFIPPGEGVTGTWIATNVPGNNPWVVQMKQSGASITGAVRQNAQNALLAQPAEILQGRVEGNTVSFEIVIPRGTTVTFTGKVSGETIVFARSGEGGVGLFGGTGSVGFSAVRQAKEEPAGTSAAALPVDELRALLASRSWRGRVDFSGAIDPDATLSFQPNGSALTAVIQYASGQPIARWEEQCTVSIAADGVVELKGVSYRLISGPGGPFNLDTFRLRLDIDGALSGSVADAAGSNGTLRFVSGSQDSTNGLAVDRVALDPAERARIQEEVLVYQALIASGSLPASLNVLRPFQNGMSVPLMGGRRGVPAGGSVAKQFLPEVGTEAALDFGTGQADTTYLAKALSQHASWVLLDQSWEATARGAGINYWQLFHARYPGGARALTITRVGFNAARTEAVLYVFQGYGGLGAEGAFYLMKKEAGVWVLVRRRITGMA